MVADMLRELDAPVPADHRTRSLRRSRTCCNRCTRWCSTRAVRTGGRARPSRSTRRRSAPGPAPRRGGRGDRRPAGSRGRGILGRGGGTRDEALQPVRDRRSDRPTLLVVDDPDAVRPSRRAGAEAKWRSTTSMAGASGGSSIRSATVGDRQATRCLAAHREAEPVVDPPGSGRLLDVHDLALTGVELDEHGEAACGALARLESQGSLGRVCNGIKSPQSPPSSRAHA